jgi:enoyl-CoA hydratase/carnithine racemase
MSRRPAFGPAASRSGYNGAMTYECILVERDGPFVTVTMNRPERRNALSQTHLDELLAAFRSIGETDARGVVLAGRGPVFSAGHDFADLAGADEPTVRRVLLTCTDLMTTMQSIPQVVVARVHALATAAGCQLVATADLAVAGESAAFAAPGGRGGWFCTTPMVAIGRAVARKHALEIALTGDTIDAATAAAWGLVNRVVPDAELDDAVIDLLRRATRGGRESKALGKQAFYEQIGLDQPDAYARAVDVMVEASQIPDAREGMSAFLEKREPDFD